MAWVRIVSVGLLVDNKTWDPKGERQLFKAVDTKKQDMPAKLFPKFVDFDQRQPKRAGRDICLFELLPEPENLVRLPKAVPGVPCLLGPAGSLIVVPHPIGRS